MTASVTTVHGTVADGFDPVRDAFAEAVAQDSGTGAALSIRRHGEVVAELWGGVADGRSGRPWQGDTPSVVFSCTKGLMAIVVARLVQDGRVGYDTRVAELWPEFAASGKGGLTVGDALAHRAGLSAPREDWSVADLLDWERATALLARQEPLWDPGTAWTYHAITHGFLAGEIVRRVTGRSPGEVFAELVAAPLHADAWIGLPTEVAPRVAHLVVGETLDALVTQQDADGAETVAAGGTDWGGRAMTLGGALPRRLVGEDDGFNRDDVRAAQVPGAGGIATAHAMASIWSAVVTETDGVRLLDDRTVALGAVPRAEGAPFIHSPAPWPRWGAGFQLDSEARRYLGPTSVGHDGAGGQVAFGDTASGVGFAFITNRMEAEDPRATRIVDALREVLGRLG